MRSTRRIRSIRPTKVRRSVALPHAHQFQPCHSPAAHVLIAALVEEMLSALREEVKEMDRNSWFYETQDPQVPMRVKI